MLNGHQPMVVGAFDQEKAFPDIVKLRKGSSNNGHLLSGEINLFLFSWRDRDVLRGGAPRPTSNMSCLSYLKWTRSNL